jgi:predicted lysophospholipase L1 biosynthesis ABC-type transport system permease subunit
MFHSRGDADAQFALRHPGMGRAPTLIAVAAVLAVSSLLASYIPARRAASVNPIEALRAE